MKQNIKKKWLKALRSGKYTQTRKALRNGHSFCCLGVLCDLYAEETGKDWRDTVEKNEFYVDEYGYYQYYFNERGGILPEEVRKWSGLSANPEIPKEGGFWTDSLAELNDSGDYNFNKLADLIEGKL